MKDFYKPAFPVFDSRTGDPDYQCVDPGMTLRDYFAAKAMQSILSSGETVYHDIAALSYAMADAMMKARGEA